MFNFTYVYFIKFYSYFLNDPLNLLNSYIIFLIFLSFAILLSCIMVVIPYFLSGRFGKTIETLSEYECGFEPFDSATRQPFTIHFYIVGILFLIFDVEISLLFPWSVIFSTLSWYGFWLIYFFIIFLTLGFIFEWKSGAISWNITKT
jgi:NADH-quinone oxidoreductase subunit A